MLQVIFDPKLIRTLHVSHWIHATLAERLEALKRYEEYLAKTQGRESLSIKLKADLAHAAIYQFSSKPSDPGIIFINPLFLRVDNPYTAVYLLLHETRHAYQRFSYIKPEMVQQNHENERELWRMNQAADGFLKKKPDKYLQPVERDATDFALAEMEKVYTILQKEYGDDSQLTNFITQQRAKLKDLEKQARNLYGEHFLAIIDHKCRQKYNLCQQFKNKYFHVTSFDSEFFPLFHKKAEMFVHEHYEQNVSLEEFEQSWQNDQAFLQALENEKARQRFIREFLHLVGEYHHSPQPWTNVLILPRRFANSCPAKHLSMDAFKAYLTKHHYHDFLTYVERRIREKNTFMENFRNIYGEITNQAIQNRLYDKIEQFLYLHSQKNLSINAFQRFLLKEIILGAGKDRDLLMFLRKQRKNRRIAKPHLPPPTENNCLVSNDVREKTLLDQEYQ